MKIRAYSRPSLLTSLYLVTGLTGSLVMSPRLAQAETLYNGVAAGDPTDTSVVLWTRTVNSNTNQGTVNTI